MEKANQALKYALKKQREQVEECLHLSKKMRLMEEENAKNL